MTGTSIFALHRRTRVERRVLAIVRGEASPAVTEERFAAFAQLRHLAEGRGLTVSPLDSPYVSENELTLIAWLADAQRILSVGAAPPDGALRATICRCAAILTELGLRLYPMTLYTGRLLDASDK